MDEIFGLDQRLVSKLVDSTYKHGVQHVLMLLFVLQKVPDQRALRSSQSPHMRLFVKNRRGRKWDIKDKIINIIDPQYGKTIL